MNAAPLALNRNGITDPGYSSIPLRFAIREQLLQFGVCV
jgi:hypothetical protein